MVTEKEIVDWYNQRHRSMREDAWRPYEAYSIFLDYIDPKSGRKLLDIGCGTGYLLRAAEQRGLNTYGVDISDEGVKIAKGISPNSKFMVGSGEELEFPDNYFDYVTCVGALEHFLDMKKGIEEMARVAKEDSAILIVVPNVNYLFWRFAQKGTEQINENLLSLEQWQDLFRRNSKLTILRIYQDKWFMNNIRIFSSINPLGVAKRTIHRLIWIFLPLNLAYQFIFVLRKG